MNCIVAFVQPFQLERVVDSLRQLPDFPGMSVSEVRGFGRHAPTSPRGDVLERVQELFEKQAGVDHATIQVEW